MWACDPSTGEAEAIGFIVSERQPGLYKETLRQNEWVNAVATEVPCMQQNLFWASNQRGVSIGVECLQNHWRAKEKARNKDATGVDVLTGLGTHKGCSLSPVADSSAHLQQPCLPMKGLYELSSEC